MDQVIFQAESLAKKYEEKYKQIGDVASKLPLEEATFRDIQVYLSPFFIEWWSVTIFLCAISTSLSDK